MNNSWQNSKLSKIFIFKCRILDVKLGFRFGGGWRKRFTTYRGEWIMAKVSRICSKAFLGSPWDWAFGQQPSSCRALASRFLNHPLGGGAAPPCEHTPPRGIVSAAKVLWIPGVCMVPESFPVDTCVLPQLRLKKKMAWALPGVWE